MSQDFADLKVAKGTDKNDAPGAEERQAMYAPDSYEDHRYVADPRITEPAAPAKAERTLGPIASGILWVEPIWIAGLAPFLLLPGQFISTLFHPILIAGLFVFWPIRLLLQHRITPRTPIDGMLALLLLLVPVGMWVSADKDASWIAAGYLLLGVAIYIAIVNWPPIKKYPWIVGLGLCLIGVGLATVGPGILSKAPTKLFENPDLEVVVRSAQESGLETVNPNILAGGLVFILPILVSLALHLNLIGGTADSSRDKVTSISLAIVCGLAALGLAVVIVLTQSRGAYIGAAAACWFVFLIRWPRMWPVWILLLVGGLGSIFWIGPDQLLGQSKFDHSINSYEGRTEIWIRGLEAIYDFPFSGTGLGTFESQIPQLYPFRTYEHEWTQPHAHNMLIQVGVDLGGIGLAAFIGLLVGIILMFSRVIKSQRQNASSVNVALAIGGVGAVVAMLVHGIFDSALWGTKLSGMPWMLYSMAVVLPKEQKNRRRRRRRRSKER